MNVKKFFATFGITTGVIILILLIAGFFWANNIYHSTLGTENETVVLDKALPNQVVNVVVIGTDRTGRLADVIMVFSLSTEKNSVSCTSIPRDTRVSVNGRYMKITESMSYGGANTIIQQIRELTGLDVHDYAVFNFKAVEEVIDALGGVEYNVPQNMYYTDPEQDLYINLRKGQQLLNGDKSLQLLRFRNDYALGDIKRTEVQRDFMRALFEQKAKLEYITSIPSVYKAIDSNIESSLSLAEIKDYADLVVRMDNPKFNTIELPYSLSDPYVVLDKSEVSKIFSENFY